MWERLSLRSPLWALAVSIFLVGAPSLLLAQVTAIRTGHLIDPEFGTSATSQVILVEDGKIRAVGANVNVPTGAEWIDLSGLSVLRGLVDTHNHLALTYKKVPENDVYYLTYVLDSTPIRAIQAVSNGMQMLSSGFTIVRDMGNAGNYADTGAHGGHRARLGARSYHH